MIKKIPINFAISSEVILQTLPNVKKNDLTICSKLSFNIKVISFIKVNIDKIDEAHKMCQYIYQQNGVLWLLTIHVKNLSDEIVSNYNISSSIAIVDQDDFMFTPVYDGHLTFYSNFAHEEGLQRKPCYNKDVWDTCPLLFYLPDEDGQELFLHNKDGFFNEVL